MSRSRKIAYMKCDVELYLPMLSKYFPYINKCSIEQLNILKQGIEMKKGDIRDMLDFCERAENRIKVV